MQSANALADVAVTGQDIPYKPFSFYEGFVYKLLHVDVEHRTVEMILKFEPESTVEELAATREFLSRAA